MDVGDGGQGGQLPIKVLADQLNLSQPEGTNCVPNITTYSALDSFLHSVAKVYAVLPFYDVKCLCSGGRE